MSKAAFVGIDWGTSNARFLLIADDGAVLDEKDGAGISQIDGTDAIEATCFENIESWLTTDPTIPVLMTGMVGSNIGWRTTDYVNTPASIDEFVTRLVQFQARGARCYIVPGLQTVRLDGATDLMRGEEVQIFGIHDRGEHLYCLPGTHSKWAKACDGKIMDFHTAQTGEVLDLIGRHSILLNPRRAVRATIGSAFGRGVALACRSAMGLESLLFTVRSQQIAGGLLARDAESYLAGVAIGCEIKSALTLHVGAETVSLVGVAELTALYAAALEIFGIKSNIIDGREASILGLIKIHESAAL